MLYQNHLIFIKKKSPEPFGLRFVTNTSRHLEDQGLDGRIISEFFLNTLQRNVDWIDLAHDRDKWRGLVDTVIKLRDP